MRSVRNRFCWRIFVLLLANCNASNNTSSVYDTSSVLTVTQVPLATDASTEMLALECCSMLKILSAYTVQAGGDRTDETECYRNPGMCMRRRVITSFIAQTKTLLLSSGVSSNQTHILLQKSELFGAIENVLLLAWLGHVVSKGDIEFDASNNVLTVDDSKCSMDKTIYSTIVVASISLLVFFIASQVIEKETTKATTAASQQAFGAKGLRMR